MNDAFLFNGDYSMKKLFLLLSLFLSHGLAANYDAIWLAHKYSAEQNNPWLPSAAPFERALNIIYAEFPEFRDFHIKKAYELDEIKLYLTREGRRILKNYGNVHALATGLPILDDLNNEFQVNKIKKFKGYGKLKGITLKFNYCMNMPEIARIYQQECPYVKRVKYIKHYYSRNKSFGVERIGNYLQFKFYQEKSHVKPTLNSHYCWHCHSSSHCHCGLHVDLGAATVTKYVVTKVTYDPFAQRIIRVDRDTETDSVNW